jgi:hypothetical protein
MSKHYKNIHAKVGENIRELLTYLSLDLPWKTKYIKTPLGKALFIDITKKISAIISLLDRLLIKDALYKTQLDHYLLIS